MSREEAIRSSIRYTLGSDDYGRSVLIDTKTGLPVGSSGGQPGGGQRTSERPGVPSSLPEDTDFLTATGAGGLVSTTANTIADLWGSDLPRPEVERASTALQNLSRRTMITVASEASTRPSQWLMKEIDELLVKPNLLTLGPGRARDRFLQVQGMLETQRNRVGQIIENSREFPAQTVAQARIELMDLDQLISDYDQVISAFGRTDGQSESGNAGQGGIPPQAVDELMRDPSEEAQREFDEVFGAGAAQRAMGGR